MKKQLIFMAMLLISLKSIGQSALPLEDLKHFRIQLLNRTNKNLFGVPKQLLEGYCEGLFKAYYPKEIYTEVNFGDFLSHFSWSEPVLNESVMCGEDYCSSASFKELFERFDLYLDYYEYAYFNTSTSRTERKVEFIQLVYSIEVNGTAYFFKGPIFRMDEIGKLVIAKNEGNESVQQSLKYTFELARFYSVEITKSEVKTKQKRTDRDDDNQEH